MPKSIKFLLRSACAVTLLLSSLNLQGEVPMVEAPLLLQVEFGKPFEYEIKASNEPIGFSVSGLPFWLKREGAFLRGTPVSKKEHILQLHAINSDGISEPKRLILRVVDIRALTHESKSVSLEPPIRAMKATADSSSSKN